HVVPFAGSSGNESAGTAGGGASSRALSSAQKGSELARSPNRSRAVSTPCPAAMTLAALARNERLPSGKAWKISNGILTGSLIVIFSLGDRDRHLPHRGRLRDLS